MTLATYIPSSSLTAFDIDGFINYEKYYDNVFNNNIHGTSASNVIATKSKKYIGALQIMLDQNIRVLN